MSGDVSEDFEIEESAIVEWANASLTKDIPRHSLRLLIGAPENHESDAEILPLPFSSSTYNAICQSWHLPSELLRMAMSTLPLAVAFDAADVDGSPLKGLMLRVGRSRDWNFCLGLVHCPSKGITCGILTGMQHDEIEKLLWCLRESRIHIRDPLLLPVFLIELRVHFFALLLEKRALGIEGIEHSTGMRHGFSTDPRKLALLDHDRKLKAKMLDFDPITQKLTGVTGTLSFCDMTFSSSKRALEVIIKMRAAIGAGNQASTAGTGDPCMTGALSRRIDYLSELIEGSQAYGTVLSARTKAQVQTVYSMIGQRDNRVNIETAAASREIAEDSRRVAVLTRKDSLDMRIIAGVTLIFLPGTFMATMFGSGFFRFLPENSTQLVSEWIWLYWTLTITITAIVLLSWVYLSKRHSRIFFEIERERSLLSFSRVGDEGLIKRDQITLKAERSRSS
ncbi:hypothetical protein LTR84_010519 [Exophiala bonariae]|uniref:Mg2+ transporter protein, CorA-like/Zinc transport protein ZntB n=1 Tax=Exophiala bonariae TaxID=1690606 RepID=A0AAV9MTL7_9EURO|nr:hypothetical protein LTR84_010519 [Exophiala bonariae]